MDNTLEVERRQSPRYALNTDVFLVFRPEFTKLGKLMDVSGGGVAFEYAVFDHYEKVAAAEVDIFASEPDQFMLSRVPCRVAYDVKIEKLTLGGIETRRCGLAFEQLSQTQSELLNLLLATYGSHSLLGK